LKDNSIQTLALLLRKERGEGLNEIAPLLSFVKFINTVLEREKINLKDIIKRCFAYQ